jgi:FG-GAP-like repeat
MRRLPAWVGVWFAALLVSSATAAGTTQPAFGPQRDIATMTVGGSVLDLTNADFTGDGLQDVLVLRGRWASTADYPISILVNDGAGHFADKAPELFDGPVPRAVWPRQALIADFNKDSRPDVLIGDSGIDQPPFPGHANHLVLSAAGGRYVDASAQLPPEVTYFHSGATGDVDSDGDTDIFLADLGTPIRLLLSDGSGHFTTAAGRFPASVLASGHERYTRSSLLDVNGDGKLDLVLLAEDHNSYSTVLRNDGGGYFSELANALPPKPFGTDAIGIAIQPVNLNGDGKPDLMLGYTKGNPFYVGRWIQLVVNNGDGTFHDETATRLPQADNNRAWPYELVQGDLNSDGAVDFAVDIGSSFCAPYCPGDRDTSAPFFLNDGNGAFAPLPPAAFLTPPSGQLRLIDVNRDGLLDVFGVAQAGMDAPERYTVQIQGDPGDPPVVSGGSNDDDGDGVLNPADRCPALAAHTANGCPGATLTRAGRVRSARAGKRVIRLSSGVKALCPPAGFVCQGTAAAVGTRPKRKHASARSKSLRLGSAAFKLESGATSLVSLKLGARGASALRRAGKLKVKVTVALTGPDDRRVTLSRTATVKQPRRH